jgi:drug/metabolite transporter (DMT)-like permease
VSWLYLSILSAILLGVYDLFKKLAVHENAVMPVLFLSICAGASVWAPFMVWSVVSPGTLPAEFLRIEPLTVSGHAMIFAKAVIVVSSWICGFHGLKRLPLSIAGPIRATAPLWTILFAVAVFHESPAPRQWAGVAVIVVSFLAFSIAGRKEGIRFHSDPGVWWMIGAMLLGAASALYDKFLLQTTGLPPNTVQAWFSVDMGIVLLPAMLWRLRRTPGQIPFHWHWAIPAIGLTLLAADFLYFTALAQPGALISVISPVRRGAVVISLMIGIFHFKERQFKTKAVCVAGIITGILMLS